MIKMIYFGIYSQIGNVFIVSVPAVNRPGRDDDNPPNLAAR